MRVSSLPWLRLLALAAAVPGALLSQSRGVAPEIWTTVGATRIFLDEPAQAAVGGALRLPLGPKLAVQPGVLWAPGSRFSQIEPSLDLAYEFTGGPRAVPYLIGGIALVRTHDKRIGFTSSEAGASAGGGVKIFLTPRIFVAPEARLGTHAFPRFTVSLGFRLDGRR